MANTARTVMVYTSKGLRQLKRVLNDAGFSATGPTGPTGAAGAAGAAGARGATGPTGAAGAGAARYYFAFRRVTDGSDDGLVGLSRPDAMATALNYTYTHDDGTATVKARMYSLVSGTAIDPGTTATSINHTQNPLVAGTLTLQLRRAAYNSTTVSNVGSALTFRAGTAPIYASGGGGAVSANDTLFLRKTLVNGQLYGAAFTAYIVGYIEVT